jgi:pyridoxine kinase
MLDAIAARGLFARCEAVLSGYLGDAAVGDAIARAVEAARAARPDALYGCDPVIGDRAEGVYVRPGIPEMFRDRLIPLADVLTPNQFELEWLAGGPLASEGALHAAARDLARARLGRTVLVTSVEAGTPAGVQRLLAVDGAGIWRLDHPTVDVRVKGTGDLIAALFLAGLLRARSAADALVFAAAAVHAVLERTRAAGGDELALVASGDVLCDPPRWFRAERVG